MHLIELKDFPQLFSALHGKGYTIVGPTVRDGAIVLDTIARETELPVGWTDVQVGGEYRLERRSDDAFFGYVVGPHSWKRFLYQPRVRLLSATRSGKEITMTAGAEERVKTTPTYAFLGVRPCEIAAIAIQDKVFMGGDYIDPGYAALRKAALVIAVNCVQPGGTCFCTSMETGPKATNGYDLALTEVIGPGAHHFIVDAGSPRGEDVLAGVKHREASKQETGVADDLLTEASERMGRTLAREGLKQILYDNFEHPVWDDVTKRCLTCTNCTMVCPTCFCSTVEDTTDLSGTQAERWRRWDSCFTLDYSRVAGGNTRPSPRSRYRQWLTHKLGYWNDQFGVSGCVGCGRCITWCPVGIDITAEAAAIRGTTTVASDGASVRHPKA